MWYDKSKTPKYIRNVVFLAKCIDHYTKLRVANADGSEDDQKDIDARLEAVVNRMFQRCFVDHQYKQVEGATLE